MKKIFAFVVVVFTMIACVCCGPYTDYAGSYIRTDSGNNTYTVTLSASGDFKFERKLSKTSSLYGGPFDNDNHNVRKGTFTIEDDKIIIEFTYYEETTKSYETETAVARIEKGKLIISNSDQIKGTYTKK